MRFRHAAVARLARLSITSKVRAGLRVVATHRYDAALRPGDHWRTACRQDGDPVGAAPGGQHDVRRREPRRGERAPHPRPVQRWQHVAQVDEPHCGAATPAGQSCVENQRPANEPSLAAMTSKAIDLLHEDDGPGPWRSHDDNFGHRRSRGLPRERTLFRVFRQLPDGSRAPACGRRLRSALRSSRSENRVPPARPRTSRRGS